MRFLPGKGKGLPGGVTLWLRGAPMPQFPHLAAAGCAMGYQALGSWGAGLGVRKRPWRQLLPWARPHHFPGGEQERVWGSMGHPGVCGTIEGIWRVCGTIWGILGVYGVS